MKRLAWIGVWCLAGMGGAAWAQSTRPTTVTFTEADPHSELKEWVYREGGTVAMLKKAGAEYDITKESFEVVVPPTCTKENPHGLLVWIPPGKASWPADWFKVAEKHKLIWVSPNNAGNSRNALIRVSLAMDAAYNLKKRYPVDEARIYVAGMSGGGRAASIAAVGFPDVFTGGIAFMGSNFYRPIPAGPGKMYPQGSFRPPGRLFDTAKSHPLVLVTSERDVNRDQTKANLAAFTHDGFKHVTLIDVPGIGHEMPTAQWFEQAVEALDKTPVTPWKPATRPTATPTAAPPPASRG